MDDGDEKEAHDASAGAVGGADPSAPPAGRTAKGEGGRVALGRRAQAVARRLAESKATIPHLYVERTAVLADRRGADPGALIAAAGRALREVPALNGAYRDGELQTHSRINVGLTVETPEGPVVPTVFDADGKPVGEIGSEVAELSDAARAGTLASPALSGGTFTLTLLESGGDRILSPVTPGQAGHLGVGRPRRAIVAEAGEPRAVDVVDLCLSCDARAVRPAEAADFLERLAAHLAGRVDPESES